MASNNSATASQAWAILSRHARDEIAPLRLQELCRDNDRVSSLVAVYNTTSQHHPEEPSEQRILIADLSRQRMTLETLNYLLKLATTRNLKKFITQLSWGQNDPDAPILPKRVRNRTGNNSNNNNQQKHGAQSQQGIRTTFSTESTPQKKTTRFDDPETLETEDDDDGGNSRQGAYAAPFDSTTDQHPLVPSMHLALRVPANKGHEMLTADGTNALIAVHREWDRIERLSDSLRRGQLRGISGSMIRDVIVIGQGVPLQALQFVYTALLKDERSVLASRFGMVEAPTARIRRNLLGEAGPVNGGAARRLKFLSTIDPIAAAEVVSDLDPASTLIISIALRGNEETGLGTKTLKSWLLHALGTNRRPDHVLAKHMMLVTGNDHIASIINKPESVHMVPEHSRCEAFTSFSAATLLVS
jgi:glucose-6-phosphate isomerase